MTKNKQKVAVVLGASAENGIGWACVRRLASEGHKVVVGARSYDKLKGLCDGIGVDAVKCDAQSDADIQQLADTAMEKYGRIDIAINSAGSGYLSTVADATKDVISGAMSLNYYAMVSFVQIMAKAMGQRSSDDMASIVLVSTMSVDHPNSPVFPYAAAKGATETMVRFAALEYGPQNIKVNTINPGFVMTDLAKSGGMDGLDQLADLAGQAAALGRIATADECADAAYWLANSAFASGLHLKVSGGAQLRPQYG